MGAILDNQRVAKRRRMDAPAALRPIKQKVKVSRHSGEKRAGFTFSIPVLPVLAVAAGAFVISLAIFNWENFSMPGKITFTPASGTQVEQHTMIYAATGVSSLIPAASVELPNARETNGQNNRDQNDIGNDKGQNDKGQNDLIAFEWQQYKVKKGDSVSGIAKKFDVSVGAVIASNDIKNARSLREGQTLKIPNIDGIPYQVKKGDSLSKIAASFNVPLEVVLDVNDIKSDNIKLGETLFIPGARMNDIDLRMSLGELFIYPVPGRFITSPYGMRKDPINGILAFHTGIDIRANTGTPVSAALDGVVSLVSENWLYGKHIIITHDNGYKTLYAHLNSYSVKQGERVARGKKIAESGNTGYSTGPHLHFSIYDKNNKLVNPLELLR